MIILSVRVIIFSLFIALSGVIYAGKDTVSNVGTVKIYNRSGVIVKIWIDGYDQKSLAHKQQCYPAVAGSSIIQPITPTNPGQEAEHYKPEGLCRYYALRVWYSWHGNTRSCSEKPLTAERSHTINSDGSCQ